MGKTNPDEWKNLHQNYDRAIQLSLEMTDHIAKWRYGVSGLFRDHIFNEVRTRGILINLKEKRVSNYKKE